MTASLNNSDSVEELTQQFPSLIHSRSMSTVKFDEEGMEASANAMRLELSKLISQIEDPKERVFMEKEMHNFFALFIRYLREKSDVLGWEAIKSPQPEQVVPYEALTKVSDDIHHKQLLSKLAVVKLNGGLGTTMGCTGPKSAIEVRSGMTFLDLTVRQIEWLNTTFNVDVPLVLMNSFNTDEETKKIVKKYAGHRIRIITFNQSQFPRIGKDSLLPVASSPKGDKHQWYPPGHGNVFDAIYNSGVLDELIGNGIEYLFVSNVDNLGATVDAKILAHAIESKSEFLMEVTNKTKADIKGGTLIDYMGKIRLLEIAQVPADRKTEFTSIKKFKIFNTNNLWVNCNAIKRVVENDELELEIIVNHKRVDSTGENVIQLETAVGAAIKHFTNGHGVNVPRSRFLPVKSCSDLFLIQSDLYNMAHGELTANPKRQFSGVPLVKLGDDFKKVQNYLNRFAGPPQILELDHLTVTGDVTFGKNVTLKGTVIIVANHGQRIDIPSGSVLEDKVVSGNLRILDH